MDDPKKKILEMVASGKITVDEASALLDKLDDIAMGPRQIEAPDEAGQQMGPLPPPVAPEVPGDTRRRKLRHIRIIVETEDGDKVNVRLPLNLIRTGIKLGSLLPAGASEAIDKSGFNFSMLAELEGDELVDALTELQVFVESEDGDKVRVFCE